jgi:putative ABC transport system substrate-binding protein
MAIGIGRRQFISAALGGATVWPLTAQAQQAERMRRIGVLSGSAANDPNGQAEYQAFLHR